MTTAKVIFRKLFQQSQHFGADEKQHMVSRIHFDLHLPTGEAYTDLYADIKQIVGGTFEDEELEVSRPGNYKGPFNFDAFAGLAQAYLRMHLGRQGTAVNFDADKSSGDMARNTIRRDWEAEMEIG